MNRFKFTNLRAGGALLLVMVVALTLAAGRRARADSEGKPEGQGLAGTWHVTVITNDCNGHAGKPFTSILAFADGGTLSGTTSNPGFQPGQRTSDYGVWSHVDDHTYKAVSDAYILFTSAPNPPVPGFPRGTQRISQDITVNGDHFDSIAAVTFSDATGNPVLNVCATASGERFK